VSKLIPETGRMRTEVRTWEALADGVLDAAVLARLEQTWPGRSEEQRSAAWVSRQMGKVQASLAAMSLGLGDKTWCAGIHFTLADISAGCALGYLDYRFAHIDWRTPYPNLAKLNAKLVQRQSFIDTVPPPA
jgi:glutathione S-transferase